MATLLQRWSCRSPDECVFGASSALRQALRGRPARRVGSLAATLATSSTPSQLNALCLVPFDSSVQSPPRFVLTTWSRSGFGTQRCSGFILCWTQSRWIRSLVIEYPDVFFLRRNKLLQNACRIDQSAVVNRTPSIFWVRGTRAVGTAVQPRLALFETFSTYLPGLMPVRYTGEIVLPCCLLWSTHMLLHGSAPLKRFVLGPTPPSCPSRQCHCKQYHDGPPQYSSARIHMQVCCLRPIVPSKPQLWI